MRILKVAGSPPADRALHHFDLTVLDRHHEEFHISSVSAAAAAGFIWSKADNTVAPVC